MSDTIGFACEGDGVAFAECFVGFGIGDEVSFALYDHDDAVGLFADMAVEDGDSYEVALFVDAEPLECDSMMCSVRAGTRLCADGHEFLETCDLIVATCHDDVVAWIEDYGAARDIDVDATALNANDADAAFATHIGLRQGTPAE